MRPGASWAQESAVPISKMRNWLISWLSARLGYSETVWGARACPGPNYAVRRAVWRVRCSLAGWLAWTWRSWIAARAARWLWLWVRSRLSSESHHRRRAANHAASLRESSAFWSEPALRPESVLRIGWTLGRGARPCQPFSSWHGIGRVCNCCSYTNDRQNHSCKWALREQG